MNAELLMQAQQIDWILKESGFYLLYRIGDGEAWSVCDGRGSFEPIANYCDVVYSLEELRNADNPTLIDALAIEVQTDRDRELRFEELILGSNENQILYSTIMDRAQEYAQKFLDCNGEYELWYQIRDDLWTVLHNGIGLEHSESYGDLWSLWTSDYHGALLDGMDLCDCGDMGYLIRDGSGDLVLGAHGEIECNNCCERMQDGLTEVTY